MIGVHAFVALIAFNCLWWLNMGSEISSELGYSVIIDAGSTGTRVYIYSFNKHMPLDGITELSNKKIGIGKSIY
jgi:Golgi nucleoside diphosphatase